MRLRFVYAPATDLESTAGFYRDVLGMTETWRDGDDTVAFGIAGTDTEVMVSTTEQPDGPMYEVDDLTAWLADHDGLDIVVDRYAIPNGSVLGVSDPSGNTVYVYDQIDAR